jgi:hypothetical protein
MSYTQDDLDAVKNAIVDLATGKRVVSITVDGRTTQWQQVDIDKLKALRDEITEELGQSSPRPLRIRPRGI